MSWAYKRYLCNIAGFQGILIPGKMLFLVISVSCVVLVSGCARDQVEHTLDTGQTVCCQPVFNCPFDHEIRRCTTSGQADQCVSCPDDHINKYLTSSLDDLQRVCIKKQKAHSKCALDDSLPVELKYEELGLPCRCDETRCWYGSPSTVCSDDKTCPPNQYMDHKTGDCKVCGQHQYTKTNTCGPCYWNETAWRLSVNDGTYVPATTKAPPAPPTPASSQEVQVVTQPVDAHPGETQGNDTRQKDDGADDHNGGGDDSESGNLALILGVAIGVIVLVVAVVVTVFLTRRYCGQRGPSYHSPEHSGSHSVETPLDNPVNGTRAHEMMATPNGSQIRVSNGNGMNHSTGVVQPGGRPDAPSHVDSSPRPYSERRRISDQHPRTASNQPLLSDTTDTSTQKST